ncbi:MAG: hypothetical protein ACLUIX_01075 [Oscillospiraceae bacterium]
MMGQHMARRLSAGAPMYYWAIAGAQRRRGPCHRPAASGGAGRLGL